MADASRHRIFKTLAPSFEGVFIQEDTQSLATRLSENNIQANTAVRERDAWIRVFRENRMGEATGAPTQPADVDRMIEAAVEDWKVSSESTPIVPPKQSELPFKTVADTGIENADPLDRANRLAMAVETVRKHELEYTGAYTSRIVRRHLISTTGVDIRGENSMVDVSCTVTAPAGNSGWARQFGTRVSDINLRDLVRTAGGKAMNSGNPEALKPGRYTVILEPAAVGSMLLFLGFLSFGGRVFNRGTSFLSGNIGTKVMSDHFTIIDDASDPRVDGWPFDYEGTPVQKVVLVENGIARGVVHDMSTAAAAGTISTGHALAPGNRFGPYPRCVHMQCGNTFLADVFASVRKGILVTRFWYINYANPMRTMITGTTRDGTFMIRDGRPIRAVANMRFVESILEAFNRATLLSRETWFVRQFGSTLQVPWMVIPDFEFTEVI